MRIGIGIDTGGTYTDIVLFDYDTCDVLAKSKTRTTKEDLTVCITRAIESMPSELLLQGEVLCLSTTLATNACVEDKGVNAKLVIVGIPQEMLARVDAQRKYGLDPANVLCVDANGSYDGRIIDEPDWQSLYDANISWFEDARALCISEVNALRNNAIVEKRGREFFSKKLDVPVTIATDLAGELNVLERGATALLNSRLVPLITDFIDAVNASLAKLGLNIPVMIVRSDGSLMNTTVARENPVQTILSGPAASVMGGKSLDGQRNCLIIDIGGTTTDISIVEGGFPAVTDRIFIGGWATQVKGVFIETFGLGGDSIMRFEGNILTLGARRVIPLCVAACQYPQIIESLKGLVERRKRSCYPDHEFLVIARPPKSLDRYTRVERQVLEILSDGPVMIGSGELPIYEMKTDRLEDEGTIMRIGMTPTDFMHLAGDFDRFDSTASKLAAMHFAVNVYELDPSTDPSKFVDRLCSDGYGLIEKRLHEYIVDALLRYRYPKSFTSDTQTSFAKIIEDRWEKVLKKEESHIADAMLKVNGCLVGIGAPTHVFLPKVAQALGVECVIPKDAEVANAIGCAVADVSARVEIEVTPNPGDSNEGLYRIDIPDGACYFDSIDEAEEVAEQHARKMAEIEAHARGAIGEISIVSSIDRREYFDIYGGTIHLGTDVVAIASGRII